MPHDLKNRRELAEHLYRSNFSAFVRFAGRALFQDLIQNWHIDVISGAIKDCLDEPGSRLIINAPPRSFKSFVSSIALPAFVLSRNPKLRILIATGSQGLARSLKHRLHDLVACDRYRSLNPLIEFKDDGTELRTLHGGRVSFVVVGHRIMGRGADLIIIDDPQTSEAASNQSDQEACVRWIKGDLLSRLDRKSQGQVILTMQRLALGDLTERLDDGGWRKLILKAVASKDEVWRLPDGDETIRPKKTALCPQLEEIEVLYRQLWTLGAMAFAAQYQQEPLARETRVGPYFIEDISNYTWSPDGWPPRWTICIVPELIYLRYNLFGRGSPPPEPYRRILTPKQFEIIAVRRQRELIASLKEQHS